MSSYQPFPTTEDGTISSIDFAELYKMNHDDVYQLVEQYKLNFQCFGPLAYPVQSGTRPKGVYSHVSLNRSQALFLMMLSPNTDSIRAAKKHYIGHCAGIQESIDSGNDVVQLSANFHNEFALLKYSVDILSPDYDTMVNMVRSFMAANGMSTDVLDDPQSVFAVR